MNKYDPDIIEYKDILMLYRDEITLYEYKYVLENNNIIKLVFKEEHFCKLLALDEFAPSQYKRREYLDKLGITKIEEGIITSEKMRKEKHKTWKTYKNRIEYFPYLKILLDHPQYIIFNKEITNTKIKADVVLLYQLSENEYIHLFCKNISNEDTILKPITFVIHKNNKYIKDQENIHIKEVIKETVVKNK